MKRSLLLLALLACTVMLKAQSTTYKPFKVDIALGYAIPTASDGSDGTKAGVVFDVHPHYRLTDAFAVGVRLEGAALGTEDKTEGDAHVKVSVLTSYCATGEYYFSNATFRPFVGAGAGFFHQSASVNSDSSDGNVDASAHFTKFGVFPEIGFEAGHFRFTADYDVLGNNSNYFAFKVGAFFGGGKK